MDMSLRRRIQNMSRVETTIGLVEGVYVIMSLDITKEIWKDENGETHYCLTW